VLRLSEPGQLGRAPKPAAFALQVDGDLQSFRQDALQLGQHEAGTPDADDGVVER
jgi:hypothetical protein